MSAPLVRYEVWKNATLAAKRCVALLRRAHALCAELGQIAERWQRAKDKYGDDVPAWSFGDWKLPDFVQDLAQRADKVDRTHFDEYDAEYAERVARGDVAVAITHRDDTVLAGAAGAAGSRRELVRLFEQRFETFGSGAAGRMGNTYGASDLELEAVSRDVGELEAFVGDIAERVRKAKGELGLFEMRLSLRAAAQWDTGKSRAPAASATEANPRQEANDRRDCAETVARLLETLSPDVSEADRSGIEKRGQDAMDSPGAARRRVLLTQLRLDIQRANAAGEDRRRAVRQIEQWRDRLLGLEGEEVEQLDATLRLLLNGGTAPPYMAQTVDDVVARATDAANRDYALGVIREELENLGYVVEVGFETATPDAPEMLLSNPAMEDDYLVSVSAAPGGLQNQVVREAAEPSEDPRGSAVADRQQSDERMQRAWCQDLATALAAAERRGVRGQAVARSQPGEHPVTTIAPVRSERKPKRRRRRRRRQENAGLSRV